MKVFRYAYYTFCCVLLLVLMGLIATGCATADTESEIPWNTPQPWEGSPMIPGMDRM